MLSGLRATLPKHDIDSEAEYHRLWSELLSKENDSLNLALKGGMFARRFAFIFCAGYQAALRQVFPTVEFDGWAAFAVSEDRSTENPLPGVAYTSTADGFILRGHKSWIAASDHCASLIVSARGDDGKKYFQVPAQAPNVHVVTKPSGRMLPDLSQGRAHLDGVRATPIAAEGVQSFAPSEVFYIYVAFLASTWARFEARRAEVEPLLEQATKLGQRMVPSWDVEQLEFDKGVQNLLADMREHEGEQEDLWRRDYKLIAMYSKQSSA